MTFSDVRFADAEHTVVLATVDGQSHCIPCDPANRHYAALLADQIEIGAYEPPPVDLVAYAAAKRRALVFGSALVDVGTRSIPSWVDPESRGAATGLAVALNLVPDLTAPWKGSDGQFYILATNEIAPFALGMMTFVQECFAAEAAVQAAISGGTITTTAEIDAAAWPSNT